MAGLRRRGRRNRGASLRRHAVLNAVDIVHQLRRVPLRIGQVHARGKRQLVQTVHFLRQVRRLDLVPAAERGKALRIGRRLGRSLLERGVVGGDRRLILGNRRLRLGEQLRAVRARLLQHAVRIRLRALPRLRGSRLRLVQNLLGALFGLLHHFGGGFMRVGERVDNRRLARMISLDQAVHGLNALLEARNLRFPLGQLCDEFLFSHVR